MSEFPIEKRIFAIDCFDSPKSFKNQANSVSVFCIAIAFFICFDISNHKLFHVIVAKAVCSIVEKLLKIISGRDCLSYL